MILTMGKIERKRIEYEDDVVIVYQGTKLIYHGIEDYDPMNDAPWKWNERTHDYRYRDYVKICIR